MKITAETKRTQRRTWRKGEEEIIRTGKVEHAASLFRTKSQLPTKGTGRGW
jgi:hypothetical protein